MTEGDRNALDLSTRTTRCRSCRAEIIFLATAKGPGKMPTDAATVKPGDVYFDRSKGHVSHFATCEDADTHRRPR